MGACACTAKPVVVSREQLKSALVSAVEQNHAHQVAKIYQNFIIKPQTQIQPPMDVDEGILSVQEIELNTLAYALRLGYCGIARFLIEEAHCSIPKLYSIYQEANKSPVDVLCEHGHLELLRYFLPRHIAHMSQQESPNEAVLENSYEQLSIFSDSRVSKRSPINLYKYQTNTQTSIQRACERGHIQIVYFLVNYFAGSSPPKEFDLHAEDERTGENCALTVSRAGNIELMRYLFSSCNADFHKLNKRKESALQLTLVGLKHHSDSGDYLECVKYLVEVIKVNIQYEYEETILLSEDKVVVDYLEKKLRALGVNTSKQRLEAEYALGKGRPKTTTRVDLTLEERIRNAGPHFCLGDIFKEELNSKSNISSISQMSATPLDITPPPISDL